MKKVFCIGFLFLTVLSCKHKGQEITTTRADVQKIESVLKSENPVFLKDMFGINAFEWDFLSAPDVSRIDDQKMELITSFGAFRHYLDWEKLEATPGNYTLTRQTKAAGTTM